MNSGYILVYKKYYCCWGDAICACTSSYMLLTMICRSWSVKFKFTANLHSPRYTCLPNTICLSILCSICLSKNLCSFVISRLRFDPINYTEYKCSSYLVSVERLFRRWSNLSLREYHRIRYALSIVTLLSRTNTRSQYPSYSDSFSIDFQLNAPSNPSLSYVARSLTNQILYNTPPYSGYFLTNLKVVLDKI